MRKVIVITGDRDWEKLDKAEGGEKRFELIRGLMHHVHVQDIFTFFSLGCAAGVDALAHHAARRHKLCHSVEYAYWQLGGWQGGERNGRMLSHRTLSISPATQLINTEVWAFHDALPLSKGTKNCVMQALELQLPVINFKSDGTAWTVAVDTVFQDKLVIQPKEKQDAA